jgi:gluconate kinase
MQLHIYGYFTTHSKTIKRILSRQISDEQFVFLEGRKIHEATRVAQEGLHYINVKNLRSMVVNMDLSKAYDRVSWSYIILTLIHLGLCH